MTEIPVLNEDWRWGQGEDSLFEDSRPPYHVRSMQERKSIPRNGLIAVSTFSGCGGSSLGLKTAGYEIPYAVEFTAPGAETYRANAPETFVDQRDIREIQPSDILDHLGLKPGELDLFEGSPPCSSFSAAGTPRGGEFGDTKGKVKLYSDGIRQATDDLFPEWVRLVDGLRPKALIAENVPDMLKEGPARKFTFEIQQQLGELGYEVYAHVYHSLHAGAATMRKRLIFLGVRRDVGLVPRPVLSGEGYTVREAMATLLSGETVDDGRGRAVGRPVEIPDDEWQRCWSDGTGYDVVKDRPQPRYEIADRWELLEPGTCDEKRFTLFRSHWDRPLPTLTAAGANPGAAAVMHPDQCRKFTATEVKWMSGFPADFILTGSASERYERIGRAVTPPLYEALSPHLANAIKRGL